jgi:DNA repair protein RecO (recombination protein O)
LAVRRITDTFETRALVLGRVSVGEADLLLQVLTEGRGLLTISARGSRKARSPFGVLEPMHRLQLRVALAEGREIATLREARIDRARVALIEDESRLHAALGLLRFVKDVVRPHDPDPDLFRAIDDGLDAIEGTRGTEVDPELVALRSTVHVLGELGYSIELRQCARCGKPCGDASAALVDPEVGGLVCRACGGGPLRLSAADRRAILTFLSGPTLELGRSARSILGELALRLGRGTGRAG